MTTTTQARIWNRFAAGYAKKPVDDPDAYQVKLDKTASLMTPDMNVLEFGCGTGITALYHAGRVNRIDALDFSSEMIGYAKARPQAENVQFHVSTLEDWGMENGPYQMIMAHSVLHLVSDLDATLAEVRKRLKPGDWFVSSTVCVKDINRLLAFALPAAGLTRFVPKVLPFSAAHLQNRIEAAGFTLTEVWRPGPGKAVFIIAQAI